MGKYNGHLFSQRRDFEGSSVCRILIGLWLIHNKKEKIPPDFDMLSMTVANGTIGVDLFLHLFQILKAGV